MRIPTGICLFIWTARGVLATGAWAATVATAGSPSDTLNVGRAVQLALSQGVDAIAADAARLESRASLQSARSALLPHVGVSLQGNLSGSRIRVATGGTPASAVADDSRNASGSASLSWSLLDPSAITSYTAARLAMAAAEQERADSRLSIAYAARKQFWTAVQAARIADVAAQSLALAREEEHRTAERERVGAVPRADLLKARLQTAQSVLDSLSARKDADVQRLELLRYLGRPADAPSVLDTTLGLPSAEPDLQALLREARANRPDVAASELRVRAADWTVSSARHARGPSLTLTGSSSHGYAQSDDQPGGTTHTNTEYGWSGALALTQPIFDGGGARARITSAEAGLLQSAGNRDATQRLIETDVREAVLAWYEARQRVDVAYAQVASAEENLRGNRRRYELGNATMLELVDAQVQAAQANQGVIEAQVALILADAQVSRSVGRAVGKL